MIRVVAASNGKPERRAVVPIDDIFPHDDFNIACACGPQIHVGYMNSFVLIVHNSFDGREMSEEDYTGFKES